MSKNNYAIRKDGKKIFCKTTMCPTGILAVDFYLPKAGFSIMWRRDAHVHISKVRNSMDGRKTIVRYMVHPSLWLGESFNTPKYACLQEVLNSIVDSYICI